MTNTHSKLIAVIIVCITFVGSVIFYKKNTEKKETPKEARENIVLLDTDKNNIEMDSDNDGLKDWQENIIRTNPILADTDLDGTIDGDEVKNNRDPLKKGNDKITSANKEVTKSENWTEENLTDKFATTLMANYLENRQLGGQLTQPQLEKIIENSIENDDFQFTNKKYDIKDIKIDKNVNKIVYGKNIENIVNKNSPKNTLSEVVILNNALKNEDEKEFQKLDPIIIGYQNIIKQTLDVGVPKDAIGLHIVYLNTLSSIEDSIRGMKDFLKDPVKSYIYMKNYEYNVAILKIIIDKYKSYLNS